MRCIHFARHDTNVGIRPSWVDTKKRPQTSLRYRNDKALWLWRGLPLPCIPGTFTRAMRTPRGGMGWRCALRKLYRQPYGFDSPIMSVFKPMTLFLHLALTQKRRIQTTPLVDRLSDAPLACSIQVRLGKIIPARYASNNVLCTG
jgi:hypothetical protein